MQKLRIIKYEQLRVSAPVIDGQTDRAIADYRGFLPIASVHASRVTSDFALDVMIEVIEKVQAQLLEQRKRLKAA